MPPTAPLARIPVDAADKSDGRTALHRACCHHSTKCIELLLKHGASVFNKSKRGVLPMEEALLSHRLEVEWDIMTPAETIVERISHKDLSAIQALVQPCKEQLVTLASKFCTQLKLVPLVALLLVAGHLVNAVTKKTILDVLPPGTLVDHLLSKVLAPLPMRVDLERPVEAMQRFQPAPSDVDVQAPVNQTVLKSSAPDKDKRVAKPVHQTGRKVDIWSRERLNNPQPVQASSSHPPPNSKDENLHSEENVGPTDYTSFEMAMKLLECVLVFRPRLSPHAQSWFLAPLIRACQANDSKVVDLLLRSGAKSNEQDSDGNTAMHWILRQATTPSKRPVSLSAIQSLLDAGASILQGNRKGATPVHTAAGHGHFDALLLMLEKNPTGVRVLSTAKETPLHYATMNNHVECGAVLLKFGANRNVRNDRDMKARNLATSLEMYALLGVQEITVRKSSWRQLADMYTICDSVRQLDLSPVDPEFPVRRTAILYLYRPPHSCLLADSHVSFNVPEIARTRLEEEHKIKRLTPTSNFWVAPSGSNFEGDRMMASIIKLLTPWQQRYGSLADVEFAIRRTIADAPPTRRFTLTVMENSSGLAKKFVVSRVPGPFEIEEGNILVAGTGGPLILKELRRSLDVLWVKISGFPPGYLFRWQQEISPTQPGRIQIVDETTAHYLCHTVDAAIGLLEAGVIQVGDMTLDVDDDLDFYVLPEYTGGPPGEDLLKLGVDSMKEAIWAAKRYSDDNTIDEPILARTINIQLTEWRRLYIERYYETDGREWDQQAYINEPYGVELHLNREDEQNNLTTSWEEQLGLVSLD